jgi:TolB protein
MARLARAAAVMGATLAGIGLALPVAGPARAEDRPVVVVTPGSQQTYRAAIQRFADLSTTPSPERSATFQRALRDALEFSDVFRVVDPAAFLGPEATVALDGPPPVCSDWTSIGADVLIEGELRFEGLERSAEFRVWDAVRCRNLLRKRYRDAGSEVAGLLARRIADDVVEAFTGVRGVAATEIAFVSNRDGNSEIYVMDADGSRQRPATANRSINNFPSWSPGGDSILYTSYRSGNRPMLFISTRGRGRPGPVLADGDLQRPQYRGVFDPNGGRVAAVLSADGAAEIFTVQAGGRRLRRLTNNRAIDVAPTWSPDGDQIAFVSDRSGSPQIYIMDSDGKNVRRLTYDGSYNSHPAWSPDGKWIAYETRLQGQFDLWLIDPDGSVNVPLVSHPRSDESPTWSPDGRKIAFSSTRKGRADIYVIDVSGGELRRLTRNAGSNTSPAWGPHPR